MSIAELRYRPRTPDLLPAPERSTPEYQSPERSMPGATGTPDISQPAPADAFKLHPGQPVDVTLPAT